MEENELETLEEIKDVPEDEVDTTDWKAEALKNAGIAKRLSTKLEKMKSENLGTKPVETIVKPETTKEDLDYSEKAFLVAKGIEETEFDLVKQVMKDTGKSKLEDVINTKYFQAELKERKEARQTKEAIPEGTKRSGTVAKDNVEYWLAKGTLPPVDQPELRRAVNNARLTHERNLNKFTNNPIV